MTGAGRDDIERLQWDLAQQLLRLGQAVVIEWGTWSRHERDLLLERAQELDAATELHHTHAPVVELFDRIDARGAEDPPITHEQVQQWASDFEVPTAREAACWGVFRSIGPRPAARSG